MKIKRGSSSVIPWYTAKLNPTTPTMVAYLESFFSKELTPVLNCKDKYRSRTLILNS